MAISNTRYWCFIEEQLRTSFVDYHLRQGMEAEAVDREYRHLLAFMTSEEGQKLMPGHCRDESHAKTTSDAPEPLPIPPGKVIREE